MYYVYVLLSRVDSQFYTGATADLKTRLKQHNEGMVSSTTKKRPLELTYYQACICQEDALGREKYLKTGMPKRYLRNRLEVSLRKL